MSQPLRLSRPLHVGITGKRVAAAVLALSAADVGVWASIAPRSFFRSFPLPGHRWVAALGPYNDHLTRDVGGLYLSLLVVSAWAVAHPRPEILRLAGAAWLAFSAPHLLFHLAHLEPFDTVDQVGNVTALVGTVVLAAFLLLPARDASQAEGGSAP
jgi:hypothetical protein